MPTRPLGPHTITILVPTEVVDTRDNTVYFEYVDGATVRNCNVQAFLPTEKFQEEFTTEREGARTFYRVYAPTNPYTLAIDDTYRLRHKGVIYEVHSLSGVWEHFSGASNHVAFLIKRRV
jgi:hypothetical protein